MGRLGLKIGVVIQARMGSSRLPGKVLRRIADKTLLEHVIGRLEQLRHSASVVVATSTQERDAVICEWCNQYGVNFFRGSELNVLERYVACADHYNFSTIVRLTADNPFTDIEELDLLLDLHVNFRYDYSHSFGMMPLGVGAEVFSYESLRRSYADGREPHHLEHVNEYISEHSEKFSIGVLEVPASKRSPNLRLTVDTEEDWKRACWLAEQAPGRWIGTEEAIALCSQFA